MTNNATQLKDFFGTPENPVKLAEFQEFWKSLSETEKEEFRNADLS